MNKHNLWNVTSLYSEYLEILKYLLQQKKTLQHSIHFDIADTIQLDMKIFHQKSE